MARRIVLALVLIVLLVAGGLWFLYSGEKPPPERLDIAPAPQIVPAPAVGAPDLLRPAPSLGQAAPPPLAVQGCPDRPAYADAARTNADTVKTRVAAPMGRQETGWEIYAPLAAHEVGVACAAETTAFAAALAAWQKAHKLPDSGAMDPETLEAMRLVWHSRRPFVAATRDGQCPAAPDEATLAQADKAEGYAGKAIKLRAGTLAAWRRMVAAARAERPEIAADARLLTIFSGFRGPSEEAARCLLGACSTPAKASCSAHRTGLAVDLYLGAAPGSRPESSDDANRLFQSRGAAYRWLVDNAARYGFTPYPFEPWHWEWTGEAP
jgi:hypothetical protein